MPWNFVSMVGNPTRSTDVNDLIKAVVRKETRHEGKESQARRPFEKEEFVQVVRLCSQFQNPNIQYGIPALFKFAFHMIARLDDSCEFKTENFQANLRYPETLLGKLRWSKNVRDERDCPFQILIGSMDPFFCVLLGLGLHLETSFSQVSDQSDLLFHFGLATPQRANNFVSRTLRENVLVHEDFMKKLEGLLGTHSVRKYATTRARRNCCSKDDTDCRGRWKKYKRQQDKYADVDLPYPDGKVAVALCAGGACKYVLKSGGRVTDEWIRTQIVPNISNHFDPKIAAVLGTAVLWSAFDSETSDNLPQSIRRRITSSYTEYVRGSLEEDENPVEKVQFIASEVEGVLFLDELLGEDDDTTTGEPESRGRRAATTRQGHTDVATLGAVHELTREVRHLRSEVAVIRANQNRFHDAMNRNISRLAQPFGRRFRNLGPQQENQQATPAADDGAHAAGQTMELNARLSRNPKTLYVLWEEYTVGLGGFKAARLFSTAERGRSKFTYCRRKHVWDKISELIRAGYTSETAIDKMYTAYGESLPVTKIITAMMQDRKNGGHPNLRI
jgi:hypothetical protein